MSGSRATVTIDGRFHWPNIFFIIKNIDALFARHKELRPRVALKARYRFCVVEVRLTVASQFVSSCSTDYWLLVLKPLFALFLKVFVIGFPINRFLGILPILITQIIVLICRYAFFEIPRSGDATAIFVLKHGWREPKRPDNLRKRLSATAFYQLVDALVS
ncbi:MAG: hypothetical protein KGJ57_22825 [Sphingomonadales bacterium]|nr:hypothetical protein [Sphingomonadales bacterium]MDE2172220.1 hypothetical protein [Sphingomonadales bacterium]